MLVAIGDTHARAGHHLEGRTLEAVRAADCVVHTGDFLTEAVFEAVDDEAERLVAVHGNNDEGSLERGLPGVATGAWDGYRLVVVHGHEHTETGLSMLARQEAADLVIVGHSHRPAIDRIGEATLVNPGSYAQPRGYEAAHAEITATREGIRVRLVQPDGVELREVNH